MSKEPSKEPDELVDQALMSLPVAHLDTRVSRRVLAIARANMASRGSKGPQGWSPARLAGIGLALSRAAVPALLASAAVERTIETISVAGKIYNAREPRSDAPRPLPNHPPGKEPGPDAERLF